MNFKQQNGLIYVLRRSLWKEKNITLTEVERMDCREEATSKEVVELLTGRRKMVWTKLVPGD